MNIKTQLISGSTSIENGQPDAFCCNVQVAGRGIHHQDIPQLIDASADLLEACRIAAELVKTARQHFPKSIRHPSKFQLENACAAITAAIAKANLK